MTEALLDNQLLFAQITPLWVYKLPGLVFAFCFGACVGSFLNVVSFRLPEGISIISPPSRCPTCGAKLTWKENFPILGWLLLRGKCKYCDVKISPQYVVIELMTALFFLGLAFAFYVIPSRVGYFGQIAGPWWYYNGFIKTSPAFIAFIVMYSGLIAMTLIDARTFTIPIAIPNFVAIFAFFAYGIQGLIGAIPKQWTTPIGSIWPIPQVDWTWSCVAFGGILGVLIAFYLLKKGKLRYSFADYDEYVKEGEVLGDYPHARREMLVEVIYLLPCILLMIAGYFVGKLTAWQSPPLVVLALGSSIFGYLFAGGLVWGARIIFSIIFGKEALGLGDVHLMAAVGAVIGWQDPIFIFFTAAIVGLVWVIATLPFSLVFKNFRRELPYGPHLAVATLIILILHPVLYYLPTNGQTGWWGVLVASWRLFLPNFP